MYEHIIKKRLSRTGVVLAEVIVIMAMIALFTTLVMMNFGDLVSGNSFKGRANELVELFQMASTAASQTDARYEVVIDFVQNNYLLREITTGLCAIEDIQQEEIIQIGEFNDRFQVSYVAFDDGEWTNESPAFFRAGRNGWQYGGKVVLLDEDAREYSIIINRLNRTIELIAGDIELKQPRIEDEMGF